MNIQTIATSLRNTIAGKEEFLSSLNPNNPYSAEFLDDIEKAVRKTTIEFLKINIAELKRILADIEQCKPEWNQYNCPYAAAETCHRVG